MNLSVSTIEAFRMLQCEDWMDLDRFADQILRREEPSEILLLGRAFDLVLEDPAAYRRKFTYECDGYKFDRAAVDELLDELPQGLPQVTASEEIAGHVITGRCDLITGLTVHDWKVTKQINAMRYLDSYQWRLYLVLFGCRQFVYHPVQLLRDRDTGYYAPRNYTPVTTYAYPGMEEDVRLLVDECATFLVNSGLAEQMEQSRKQRHAAA